MTSIEDIKRAAARAAVNELPDEGIVGLGTGSTTMFFLDAFAELIRAGRRFVGVPTSIETRRRAQALGIPLLSDEGPWEIAVTVDGADEVDPALDLIKGGGAAQTREKIVNFASTKNVIIVDESKLSPRLGERRAVPIEVLAFADRTTQRHLERFGKAVRRDPVRTDAGNLIYDLEVGPITDVRALDAQLHAIPGVVETGLFVGRADVVIVASESGISHLRRPT